jgi:hypothetical protein
MKKSELKDFFRRKIKYNTLDFIESDPVQIPHLFTRKEDIEIAGFLSATMYEPYYDYKKFSPYD